MSPASTSTSTVIRRDTLARELALKLLYVLDVGGVKVLDDQLPEILSREVETSDVREQGHALFNLTREHLAELDARIQEVAINWQLSRMPAVDRAILRLGTCELLHAHEVPPKVAISEAIELAKKYSTEKSGAFVNGVLDKLYQTLCPDKA